MMKRNQKIRKAIGLIRLVIRLGLAISVVAPQSNLLAKTWVGNGPDNNWSTKSNWSGWSRPIDGSTVYIDPSFYSGHTTLNNDRVFNLTDLIFSNSATAEQLRLTGRSIGLTGASGIINKSWKEQNIDLDLRVSSDQHWESGGNLFFNVTYNVPLTPVTDINGNVAINHQLELTGNFNLDGNLTGSGNMIINHPEAIARHNSSGQISGEYVFADTRTRMTGNNSGYTGDITIEEGGRLRLDGGDNLSDVTHVTVDGELDLNGTDENFGGLSGGVTGRVDLGGLSVMQIGANNLSSTFSGEIVGDGSLIKVGAGTLTLAGANSYSGTTLINEGSIKLGADNVLADNSDLTLNGGLLDLDGRSELVSFLEVRSGAVYGDGTLSATNTILLESGAVASNLGGTAVLYKRTEGSSQLSGNNSYSGDTHIAAGSLQVSAAENLGLGSLVFISPYLNLDTATLNVTGTMALSQATELDADGNFDVNSTRTLTMNGKISGAGDLKKSGLGTLELNSTNTYSGDTIINAGSVRVASSDALGVAGNSVVFAGGELTTTEDYNNTRTTTLAGAGTINVEGGKTFTQTSDVSGTGQLSKQGNGALILNGSAASVSEARVSDGILQTGANERINDTARLRTQGNGEFRLDHHETVGNVIVEGGSITGTGTLFASNYDLRNGLVAVDLQGKNSTAVLEKNSDGTVVLTGVNTYAGGTEVNRGTLKISSDQNLGASTGALVIAEATLKTSANIEMGRAITLTGECVGSKSDCEVGGGSGSSGSGGGSGGKGGSGSGSNSGGSEPEVPRLSTFDVEGGTQLIVNGNVAGAGGLAKAGAGTLVMNGVSSYTGGTSVSQGTLQGTTTSLLGDISNEANVVFDQSIDGSYNGEISGAGSLGKSGAGKVTLTGSNTYLGATMVKAGTLELGKQTAIASNSQIEVSKDARLIAAQGTVLAGPVYNEGIIEGGTSQESALLLTGSVQGQGSYEGHVTFSGALDAMEGPISGRFGGDLSFTDTSELLWNVGSPAPGVFNALKAASLIMDGSLIVSNIGSFIFEAGQTFSLLSAVAGISFGENFNLIINGLTSNLSYNTSLFNDDSGQHLAVTIYSQTASVPAPGTLGLLLLGLLLVFPRQAGKHS